MRRIGRFIVLLVMVPIQALADHVLWAWDSSELAK